MRFHRSPAALALTVLLSFSTLVFAGTASIDATVKLPAGASLKNAQVRIEPLAKGGKASVATPDARGRAAFNNLEAGNYRVSGILNGKVFASQNVKTVAGKSVGANLA